MHADEGLPASQAACGDSTATAGCLCSPAVAHKNSCVINCANCSQSVLLACLIHQYALSGGPSRNSAEWLQAFLTNSGFVYMCLACRHNQNKDVGNSTLVGNQHEVAKLRADICSIKKTMESLSVSVSDVTHQIITLKDNILPMQDASDVTVNNNSNNHKPTYASMVSKSFVDSVKKAVSESLKDRDVSDRDNASIVLYGLKEAKQDGRDASNILNAIAAKCKVVACYRLGRATESTSASRPRPLKVVLPSTTDRQQVLKLSNKLKGHKAFGGVNIAQWLPRENYFKIKKLRQDCQQLNSNAVARPDGKKPYVVTNGRLMERSEEGKLNRVNQATTVLDDSHDNACSHTIKACVGDSLAKNDQQGSHVTP